MPLPRQEVDATTPKYLRDKYAIVGVGETTYTRGSNKTTRALGTWAVRNAILDAGLQASDIDGMLDYSGGDFDQRHVHLRRPRAFGSISTWMWSAAAPRPRRWSASRSG